MKMEVIVYFQSKQIGLQNQMSYKESLSPLLLQIRAKYDTFRNKFVRTKMRLKEGTKTKVQNDICQN